MADSTLTPDEQRFFETGELQPGMTPASAPAPDPLDLQALGNAPAPPPAPVVNAPAPAPAPTAGEQPAPTVNEATEILRRSLAEAQQRVGALEQFIQNATNQKPVVNEESAPDPATDPLGAMMHKLESLNRQVADLQSNIANQQNQQTQVSQFQTFQQHVRTLTNEFAKTTPDFQDAYAHIRNARVADLRLLGYNEQQINTVIFQEEAALADAAIRQARNPAEVIYDMAKRHGYTPKTAAATGTPQKPDDKLNAIAAAQAASRSLPKSPVVDDITIEGLKDASNDDLNKLVLDPKTWARIVGSDQYPL